MTDRFLATKAKLRGLSKNKIILASIVISTILIVIVLFSGSNDVTQKQNLYNSGEDSGTYKEQSNKNNVDAILNQIEQSDVKQKVIFGGKKTNNSASSDVTADTTPVVDQEEERFKRAQKTNMYASVSGKSLMFSAKPSASNVSSSKPSLRDSLSIGGDNTASNGSDVAEAKSPYEVKAGSVIPAIMMNGLNSDLPGQVIAIVKQNIYDSITRQYILIPQGSRLVGRYDSGVIYGQERVAVAWNLLIYPDGSETNLKAMPGTDIEGYSGFYDQVDNHYWKLFGASFIMGVITGAMQYSQNNANTNVQAGANPTIGQTMSSSLGQQLGQTGLAITQKNLNIAPTIIIRPNYPFNIMITSDLELKPFARVE